MINEIANLFTTWGTQKYDECVSQLEHAVQCAVLAQEAGATDELVIAALLHDVGHLLALESKAGDVNISVNDKHESTAVQYLAKSFGPRVTAPIALHVEAKRYLCAVEADYFSTLSAGSVRSLEIQGGIMNDDEVKRFESLPGFADAVSLRRWDEGAKLLNHRSPEFSTFVPIMERISLAK